MDDGVGSLIGKALDCGSSSCRFESGPTPQIKARLLISLVFFISLCYTILMHNIQVREETLSHTRITVGDKHFYFNPFVALETIADATESKDSLTRLADVVYDFKKHKFIKCKWMDIDKLNGEKK